MSDASRRHAVSLSLEFAAIFWLIGLSLAFLPAWMQSQGLTSAQIGTVLALAFWGKIPLSVSLAHLADRHSAQKRILLAMSLTILLLLPQMSQAASYGSLALIWGICGALLATSIPLADSVCVLAWRAGRVDYGRTRLWGSGSFVVATVGGGWLVQRYALDVLPALMIAGAVMLVLGSTALPRPDTAGVAPNPSFALRDLLRQAHFRRFLLIAALLQSSHAMLYGFATIHWQQAGLSNATIGLLWAQGVILEIVLFAAARNFQVLSNWRLLLAMAGIAGVVRWVGFAATTDLAWLTALQCLHGFTFACLHLGAMRFIAQHAAEQQTATAQSLYDGLALGLVFGLAMALSGEAYQRWEGQAFLLMALLSAVATLLLAKRDRSRFDQI